MLTFDETSFALISGILLYLGIRKFKNYCQVNLYRKIQVAKSHKQLFHPAKELDMTEWSPYLWAGNFVHLNGTY